MLKTRCIWTTVWVLSLPQQMLLQKSLLYTSMPPHRGSSEPQSFPFFSSQVVRTLLQSLTPCPVFHHISTPETSQQTPLLPSPGSRLATPWDLHPTGLVPAWATSQF